MGAYVVASEVRDRQRERERERERAFDGHQAQSTTVDDDLVRNCRRSRSGAAPFL